MGVAFFAEEDGVFTGLDPARGPWSADHCHAGPVLGLIARALEQATPDKPLVRLSANLRRPAPLAGMRITVEVMRTGRRVTEARATVHDLEGRVCVTAEGLHLAEIDGATFPTPPAPAPEFETARAGAFPIRERAHDAPAFSDFVEMRYPPGESPSNGPTTLWMRCPPLLAGEGQSPFQTLCPIADCGNGISANAPLSRIGFINADVTVIRHRPPKGDWLAMAATSHWGLAGAGVSVGDIYDRDGHVATALQTLLLTPAG